MEKNITFTKSEAATLCNISNVILLYVNQKQTKDETVGAEVLKDIRKALIDGERTFGFSNDISVFLIDMLQFYYDGVGRAVYNNTDMLQGKARQVYEKHYNLVPRIIKKLQ